MIIDEKLDDNVIVTSVDAVANWGACILAVAHDLRTGVLRDRIYGDGGFQLRPGPVRSRCPSCDPASIRSDGDFPVPSP